MARGRRRAEPQRDGFWHEPPAWAWVLMVAGAVAIAVLAPLAVGRGQLSEAEADRVNAQGSQRQPAPTSGATSSSAPTTTTPPTDLVVVIGDSDTGGFANAGTGDAGWPALLQERLPDVEVDALTAAGAGYVTADPDTGQTFAGLAGAAPVEDAAAVIVFGSRNDRSGVADQVSDAATGVLAGIRSRAPDAQVIVIGPPWPSATVPAGVRNNRDVISAAAEGVGATFVDPLTDGWLVDQPGLVGVDGVHLSDAGHVLVADRIEPVVRKALGR